MSEWNVVQVIVTVVGLGMTVGVPIAKLVATITRLNSTIKEIQNDTNDYRQKNSETHERIFLRVEKTEHKIIDHEHRIQKIEGENKHEK